MLRQLYLALLLMWGVNCNETSFWPDISFPWTEDDTSDDAVAASVVVEEHISSEEEVDVAVLTTPAPVGFNPTFEPKASKPEPEYEYVEEGPGFWSSLVDKMPWTGDDEEEEEADYEEPQATEVQLPSTPTRAQPETPVKVNTPLPAVQPDMSVISQLPQSVSAPIVSSHQQQMQLEQMHVLHQIQLERITASLESLRAQQASSIESLRSDIRNSIQTEALRIEAKLNTLAIRVDKIELEVRGLQEDTKVAGQEPTVQPAPKPVQSALQPKQPSKTQQTKITRDQKEALKRKLQALRAMMDKEGKSQVQPTAAKLPANVPALATPAVPAAQSPQKPTTDLDDDSTAHSFFPQLPSFDLGGLFSSVAEAEASLEASDTQTQLIVGVVALAVLFVVVLFFVCKARVTPKTSLKYNDLENQNSQSGESTPSRVTETYNDKRKSPRRASRYPIGEVEEIEEVEVGGSHRGVPAQKVNFKRGHTRQKTEQFEGYI